MISEPTIVIFHDMLSFGLWALPPFFSSLLPCPALPFTPLPFPALPCPPLSCHALPSLYPLPSLLVNNFCNLYDLKSSITMISEPDVLFQKRMACPQRRLIPTIFPTIMLASKLVEARVLWKNMDKLTVIESV